MINILAIDFTNSINAFAEKIFLNPLTGFNFENFG